MNGRTCEICQAAATIHLCDTREVTPTKGDQPGERFTVVEKVGETHFYCNQHARQPQHTLLTNSEIAKNFREMASEIDGIDDTRAAALQRSAQYLEAQQCPS